jgi:hypothetical protein
MVKLKLSLPLMCLIKYHNMKTHGGVEAQLNVYLNSTSDGGELSASHSGHLTSDDRVPNMYWVGGRVRPSELARTL